ncbi:MAG: carboxypeptidase-like regulatory domain-containing protein [Bacteroidales bacterium]|nr:carboxypeptidase-like regulatory domain-containing protein [Bacteroidales bacterium]
MRKILTLAILTAMALPSTHCQESFPGSVFDGDTKQGIPYAAIHLMDTYIGTSCNESGQFVLHIPKGMEDAKVVVSSLGYQSDTIGVKKLIRSKGKVSLKPYIAELDAVEVAEFANARNLMEAVIERIPHNYRTEDAVGIWYYRNQQLLNDSIYVKSEGVMRSFLQPYNGKVLKLVLYNGSDKWDEERYRYYQTLDSILVYDSSYWRNMVGVEKLDTRLGLLDYREPSNCWKTIFSDFVKGLDKKRSRKLLLSKNSSLTMQSFTQDGKDYYRVTIAFPSAGGQYDTMKLVINKGDLAVIDVDYVFPKRQFIPAIDLIRKKFYNNRTFYTRTHMRYYKYDGKYQLDFIHREYEDRFEFSSKAEAAGCLSPTIVVSGIEECILAEHSYETADYKARYVDNHHPLNEENIKETESILRQPHNKIPW